MARNDQPTRENGDSADPADTSFRITEYPFYLIARVGGLYSMRLERSLKSRGLNQAVWRVLMVLAEYDGASMGEIAELAVMKLTTLLKLVRRLEKSGFVKSSTRASDRRVIDLRITERGRCELEVIKLVAGRAYADATAGIGRSGLRQLKSVLRAMEANLCEAEGPLPRAKR